jgi:hypothetical protein
MKNIICTNLRSELSHRFRFCDNVIAIFMTSERIYNKAINPYFILLHLGQRFARTYRNHGEALKSLITNSDRNILLDRPVLMIFRAPASAEK